MSGEIKAGCLVAEVVMEQDYHNRGHFYKGKRHELKPLIALDNLPIVTKLYADSKMTTEQASVRVPDWESWETRKSVIRLALRLWGENQSPAIWNDDIRDHYLIRAAFELAAAPQPNPSVDESAVIERCAQIAETFGPSRPIVSFNPDRLVIGRWEGEQAASLSIAASIRALAAQGEAE